MFQIHIPAKTKYILSRLTECGFEAYVVGGCGRDALMGRTPHDCSDSRTSIFLLRRQIYYSNRA